jgi:exosortase/archaeosortase family protein
MVKNKRNIYIIIGLLIILSVFLFLFRKLDLFNIVKAPFDYILSSIVWIIKSIGFSDWNALTDAYSIKISSGKILPFDNFYLMKKWILIFLAIVWITNTTVKRKIIISLIAIPIHYLAIIIKLILIIFLVQNNIEQEDARSVGFSMVCFLYIFGIKFWLKYNPGIYTKVSGLLKLSPVFLVKKIQLLINLIYGLILIELLLALFSFESWIHVIFTTSHYILALLNYESVVDGLYIVGDNCSIYMAKACLGIRTTFIFAAFVYLTGESIRRKVLFILAGAFIINIINVFRFVFLFIHLQNNDAYMWNLDVHEMFNVLVYTFIFILWVIWIEKFTDIWPHIKIKPDETHK